MTKQDAIDKARHFFERDHLLKVLHFTTDGQAFPIENRGQVHQRTLTGSHDPLITVKREEVFTKSDTEGAGKDDEVVTDNAGAGKRKSTGNNAKKKAKDQ